MSQQHPLFFKPCKHCLDDLIYYHSRYNHYYKKAREYYDIINDDGEVTQEDRDEYNKYSRMYYWTYMAYIRLSSVLYTIHDAHLTLPGGPIINCEHTDHEIEPA